MNDGFWLHREITDVIIRIFWGVVNELGTGFLERIYQRAMVIALREAGLIAHENYGTVVCFRGHEVGRHTFDLVVNGRVLVELKATGAHEQAHIAQALGYLRSSSLEVALVLNFGLHPSVHRVVLRNDRKQLPRQSAAARPLDDPISEGKVPDDEKTIL
jgi:GxxExxY protein